MSTSAKQITFDSPCGTVCIEANGGFMLNDKPVDLLEDNKDMVRAAWTFYTETEHVQKDDALCAALLPVIQAAAVKQHAEAYLQDASITNQIETNAAVATPTDEAIVAVTCPQPVRSIKLGMTRSEVENILRETSPEPAFLKRFDVYEYSTVRIMDSAEMLAPGELYSYVASTLLNGFINYIKPIKAFVLNRYLPETQDAGREEHAEELTANLRIDGAWKTVHTYSKTELMELVKLSDPCNTELGIFKDDVLILGETDAYFWYFWYDQDCSDCCIGRLRKSGLDLPETGEWHGKVTDLEDINRDTLVSEFTAYVNTLGDQYDGAGKQEPPVEWPVNKMAGWMVF